MHMGESGICVCVCVVVCVCVGMWCDNVDVNIHTSSSVHSDTAACIQKARWCTYIHGTLRCIGSFVLNKFCTHTTTGTINMY